MEDNKYDINVHIDISIPILGDESIILIAPPAGFVYKKIPFDNYIHKNKMVDGTGKVSFDFYYAVHGDTEKYVIAMEYTGNRIVKHDKSANSFEFMMNDDFYEICEVIQDEYEKELFKYFSMIHLFKEGEIARKYSFYKFTATEGCCSRNNQNTPICADMITLILYPMSITESEVNDINNFLAGHNSAYNLLKNVVINDLEYTYHILDDATNYKNLVTSLEVMFLRGDRGSKKEMLSKRIAVFLEDEDAEIVQLYEKVRNCYIDRSEAVHDGIVDQLTRAALNELRNLIRAVTKKYIDFIEAEIALNGALSFEDIKKKLIDALMAIVTSKNAANIWPTYNT